MYRVTLTTDAIMAMRIRDDVDHRAYHPDYPAVPLVDRNGDYDYDRVLYDCPECKRVHYVALECPPANAATVRYKGRPRVVETVE